MLPTSKRGALVAVALAALYFLYLSGLDRAGMLSADEPRYAAVGQSMARSGDWVTPRLWGQPWFEKPALLYWMIAAGNKLRLNPDLAPRVPVALASVAFLVFFFWFMRREFGPSEATYSTAILGTSAGWLTYSHVAVTDLPLAVCFSVSMLLLMRRGNVVVLSGIFLGLAILAKGLVPIALVLPAGWFARKRLIVVLAVAMAVAAPWYALVIARNGLSFVDDFFWKQHFARFTNASLQHVQPFWFFIPVLLAGLFPWTPLLATLFQRRLYTDRRAQFLAAWVVFGLVFFSISENKLPGYLLPILPGLAALLGIELAHSRSSSWLLAMAAALLWCIPFIAGLLPVALLNGASHVTLAVPAWLVALGLLTGALVFFLNRSMAVALITGGVILGVIFLTWTTLPALDRSVSARPYWRTHQHIQCIDSGTRSWRYGLNYYAGREVPDCDREP
ncbi:MAG: glycosyltransferase family 39 protein [Bryobacteraceae bacterium]